MAGDGIAAEIDRKGKGAFAYPAANELSALLRDLIESAKIFMRNRQQPERE